jgi:hypothetical protein
MTPLKKQEFYRRGRGVLSIRLKLFGFTPKFHHYFEPRFRFSLRSPRARRLRNENEQ